MINSLGDKESRDSYRKALVEHFKPHITDLCEDCNSKISTKSLYLPPPPNARLVSFSLTILISKTV